MDYGLESNKKKMKLMIVNTKCSTSETEKHIDVYKIVRKCVYLGSLIKQVDGSINEIERRIRLTRNAMGKPNKMWRDTYESSTMSSYFLYLRMHQKHRI